MLTPSIYPLESVKTLKMDRGDMVGVRGERAFK